MQNIFNHICNLAKAQNKVTIKRAKISCEQYGNMVGLGSGSIRQVSDFHLSNFR